MADDAGRPAPSQVIVTADDLGMHPAWDRACVEGIERGVLTSASLVTSGARYREARALLRSLGDPDVGVHLDLLSTRPLSPAREVPSLLGPDGAFPGSWRAVAARYVRGDLSPREVRLEWGRQVARLRDDGVTPTHLNSHYHLHMLPGLFDVAQEVADAHGIPHVRVVDEAPWSSRGAAAQVPTSALLWLLAVRARARLAGRRPVHCRGVAAGADLGLPEWDAILSRLPAEATEVVCHPGQSPYQDDALRSPTLRAWLRARARVTSFGSLAGPAA